MNKKELNDLAAASLYKVASSLDGHIKEAPSRAYLPDKTQEEIKLAIYTAYLEGCREAAKILQNASLEMSMECVPAIEYEDIPD